MAHYKYLTPHFLEDIDIISAKPAVETLLLNLVYTFLF